MVENQNGACKAFHQPLVALSDALKHGRLIAVVGAGASIAAGLPSWNDLVVGLRDDLNLPPEPEDRDPRLLDPLYIAEMYEQRFDRPSLLRKVVEPFKAINLPSEVHLAVARLSVQTIFTTNYDDLMERALDTVGKSFHVINLDEDYVYYPASDRVVVIKLHGDIKNPSRIVLTKSDMLDYETTHPNLLSEFKSSLKKNTALFIGTSMLDPNLERILELSVRELRENALRHYILVKGWNKNLEIYYSQHKLEPLNFDDWNQVVDFLQELAKYKTRQSKQSGPLAEPLPEGYILVEKERFDQLASMEEKELVNQFNRLAELYRKGGRHSILEAANALWAQLEKTPVDRLKSLKAKSLILLSQIAASAGNQSGLDAADRWLEKAESLSEESTVDNVRELRAVLMHLHNETDDALKQIVDMPGDSALCTRLAMLLDRKRVDDAEPLVKRLLPNVSSDVEAAKLVAKYYFNIDQPENARQILDPWLERSHDDPLLLEIAGYLYAELAQNPRKEFCRKHNLFPNFSIILLHDQLLDCGQKSTGARSAAYFETAAKLLADTGEERRALQCYANAYAISNMCKASPDELQRLARLIAAVQSDEPMLSLNDLVEPKVLESKELVDFDKALQREQFFLYILSRLEEWAARRQSWIEAANYLERPDFESRIATVEDQAFVAIVRMALWEGAGEPGKALQVIDSFVPPVEYAYLSLVLRAGHFIRERQDQAAEEVIEKLRKAYSDNPVVLAQLCEWHELNEQWGEMQITAEKLLSVIPIPQTYDYYLTSLGKQRKFEQLLNVLERAKAEHVKLSDTWTLINRARALIGLNRFEEALKVFIETERVEQSTDKRLLKPEDQLHMVSAYALTGNRDEALKRANELIKNEPNFVDGYIAIVQLHRERSDMREALDAVGRAAKLFPDNEQILALQIQILLLSGRTEGITEKIKQFQDRYPESEVLRTVSQKQGLYLLKQSVKQAYFAEDLYVRGGIPAIQTEFLQSNTPSYFRFWQMRKKYKKGIYISCGEQGEEWRRLLDPVATKTGAVMDFPALVTAFELQERFRWWEGFLKNLFPKIYLPTSFREVLAIERSSLFGQIQVSRYKSLRALRDRVETDRKRFPPPIQPISTAEDVLGHESERAYAVEHGCFYFNEYGDDESRIPKEFGFQELAVHLLGRGLLTASQQQNIEKLARTNRVFQPLPTSKESMKEIVASVPTLEALIEMGLFESIVTYFETIRISEIGKALLIEEISSTQFTQDVAERFEDFERYIKGLEHWIEWISVSEDERNNLVGQEKEQVAELSKHAIRYYVDLFAVALRKKCLLITDDRATKMEGFAKENLKDPTDQILRLGSDTLVRYFYHGPEKLVGRAEYVECYRQLTDWDYRHLPLDADVVMEAWPSEEDLAIIPTKSPIHYFSKSLVEYLNVIVQEKRLARNILQYVVNEHGRQLALLLRWAFRTDKPKWQVAAIFKLLELSFISNMFKDKFPESFPVVLANLWAAREKSVETNEGQSDRLFLEWLESILELAGVNTRDITSAWQSYILRILMVEFPKVAPDAQIKEKGTIVAYVLDVLPNGTKKRVFVPHIRRLLDEKLHLKFVARRKYVWRTAQDETESASIADEKIASPPFPEILAAKTGEYVADGVKWSLRQSRPDDFLLHIGILPARADASEKNWRILERGADVLDLISHPDRDVRRAAWKRALVKLRRFNLNTRDWDRLGTRLLDESAELWEPAARDCSDVLLSDRVVAVDILTDMLEGGSSFFLKDLFKLDMKHVRNWFPFGALRWHDAHELREWARIEADRIGSSLNSWKEMRQWAFCSLFPDVEMFRERLKQVLLEEVCESELEAAKQVNILLDEGDENPWPFYKINIALTVMGFINDFVRRYPKVREGDLWTNRQHSGAPIHVRVEGLLKAALTPIQALSVRDVTRESALLGFSAYLVYALSSHWQQEEKNRSVEMRRYLATVAGGYLATELGRRKKELPADFWLEPRTHLFRLATKNAWTIPDTAQGLYKPSLLGMLEYQACFAVPGLTRHSDSIRAYVMSDELRNRFFEAADLHRFFYALSFSERKQIVSWLDECLDKTHNAGIPKFVAQAAGSSIDYWSDDQRAKVKELKTSIKVNEELKKRHDTITRGDERYIEPACIILITAVWLGYVNKRTGWEDWLLKCLDDHVVEQLVGHEDTYRLMLFAFSQLLVCHRASENLLMTITHTLLRSPESFIAPAQLTVHGEVVQLLLIEGWYDNQIAIWLRAVAWERSISFGLRRKIIGNITASFGEMSETVRLQLYPMLQQIAEDPEWQLAPELAQFKGGES